MDFRLDAGAFWWAAMVTKKPSMENKLSCVVDSLSGLIRTALADGPIDFVDQRWCDHTGLSADEVRGRG